MDPNLADSVKSLVTRIDEARASTALIDDFQKKLEDKDAVLQGVVCEHDALLKEKGEALLQLEAKDAVLQGVVGERAALLKEKGERLRQLEAKAGELQKAEGERDAFAKEKGEALRQVAELKQQLEASQAEAQRQVAELKQQLEASQAEANSCRKENDLTFRQLHQVQEELEHYFLLSRKQSEMLTASNRLNQRMTCLVAAMNE